LQNVNGLEKGVALQRLQEAQLFIDAAHSCYNKLSATIVAAGAGAASSVEKRA
jgi:hypothetical protein